MRIDCKKYRRNICPKCEKFTGDKPVFGKCMAHFDDIYRCARERLFSGELEQASRKEW